MYRTGETNGDCSGVFWDPHFQKDRFKLEKRGKPDKEMSGSLQRCDQFSRGSFAGLSEQIASENNTLSTVFSLRGALI